MNDKEFAQLAGKLVLKAPAERSAVESCMTALGVKLPDDYISFFLRSNGADGSVGETGYLSL